METEFAPESMTETCDRNWCDGDGDGDESSQARDQ
jgi:hypothetical protein